MKNPEGQMARWMNRMHQCDFKIQHRAGRHHNADAFFMDELSMEWIADTNAYLSMIAENVGKNQ